MIVESNIAYLDTIDSPATDLKTAFEVLCRASKIRDRLNLIAVACVFDQSFYAKAMEVFWKNRQLYKHLIIMMGGFHLLMMLLGVIGTRFGDAGLRELAIESDAIAEGSIERVLNGKNYNRSLRVHKIFYEPLMEVFWKNRQLYKHLIIMMGGFHLLMMLLGVIGTRFGDAGLRELAIESDAIAEGSIERVLNGKNYNRSLRVHKIFDEALMILLLNSFGNSLSDNNAELLECQKTVIEELKLDISPVGYTNLLQHDDFKTWHKAFQVFVTNLREKGSDLMKFWLSYLEICELVLNLIYATRTGNWTLYLSCIEEVILWCFAYDCQNYARYLIPFLNDMLRLPSSMPEVYNAFLNGEFSVQMVEANPFG